MTPARDILLITGSNGRIGSAMMRRMTGQFSDVVGFDRKAPAPPPPDCVGIPVDLASDESVREGLRILRAHHGTHIASVVHLAAYFDFLGKPSPKYDQITVNGTRRLLRGLLDRFEVEQFIAAGTRSRGNWFKHFSPRDFSGAERHRRRLATVAELERKETR